MDLGLAYVNARVKGMKSKLLPPSSLRQMLSVRTLNEVVELLEEGPYKDSFVEASVKYSGRKLVLHALFLDFNKAVQKLVRVTPPKYQGVLSAVLKKWDVQSIQLVLSSKALQESVDEDDLIFLEPSKKRSLKELINANSFSEALKALDKTEYRGVILRAMPEFEKSKDYRVFVNALDAYYFRILSDSVGKTNDRNAESLLKSEINVHNFLLVLRMKYDFKGKLQAGKVASPETIIPFLVKGGNYSFAVSLAKAQDFEGALNLLNKKYKLDGVLEEVEKTSSLTPLEIALDRLFTDKVALSSSVSVLSFGTLMGYLYLKQKEILTVRGLTFATELGL
ncbi:MAG: V-type ATPase subunit, partial [Candidatus Micrarchaeia archaeon]